MTANENTAIGSGALYQNTTGDRNVAVGFQALYTNSTAGNASNAVGYQALYNSNGFFNNAVGWRALYNVTTGGDNVGFRWRVFTMTLAVKTHDCRQLGDTGKAPITLFCLGAFAAGENFQATGPIFQYRSVHTRFCWRFDRMGSRRFTMVWQFVSAATRRTLSPGRCLS
jgi:hypothetical protein